MTNKIPRLLKTVKLYNAARTVYYSLKTIYPLYVQHRWKMLKFYAQFVRKGDLCFDVGANMGSRTEILLALGAIVVAIEPQDACVRHLWKKHRNNNKVIVIPKALGEKEGNAELMICEADTLSSLSKEWIASVTESGRFAGYEWGTYVRVPVTTLDKLIEKYGMPAFCKIDVEGFEFEVIKGLSQPISRMSFEFVAEFIDGAIHSIKYLSTIGIYRFNYSIGESMRLELPDWVDSEEICNILTSSVHGAVWGDVYGRLAHE